MACNHNQEFLYQGRKVTDCARDGHNRSWVSVNALTRIFLSGDNMIEQFTGTPGSGKSLHCAREIKTYLNIGRNVISTCWIDTDLCFLNLFQKWYVNHFKRKPKKIKHDRRSDNFHYITNNDLDPDYLYSFAAIHHEFGKEHQTILVIDECQQIFSPTIIGNDVERWNKWDTFFRIHRHIGFDVILIPQSSKLISRKVIEYCEFETRHFNRKHHGLFGFLASLFVGGLFSYTKMWRGTREPLEQQFYTYKPIYGLMYNSYSLFDVTLKPFKEKEKQKLMQELVKILNERRMQLENNTKDNSFNCGGCDCSASDGA